VQSYPKNAETAQKELENIAAELATARRKLALLQDDGTCHRRVLRAAIRQRVAALETLYVHRRADLLQTLVALS
jgi:hypothetical protein